MLHGICIYRHGSYLEQTNRAGQPWKPGEERPHTTISMRMRHPTCTRSNLYMYTHTLLTCTHAHISAGARTHICTCTHPYLHMRIPIFAHAHTHIYAPHLPRTCPRQIYSFLAKFHPQKIPCCSLSSKYVRLNTMNIILKH